MNDSEKWSMISYTGCSQDKTPMINPIMLRFRPIAPKPVAGETGSSKVQFDNKSLLLCKPRGKRKYVRVRKNNNTKRKNSISSSSDHHDEASKNPEKIVTLQLLPEKTEANGSINNRNGAILEENQDLLYFSNLNNYFNNSWVERTEVIEEERDRMSKRVTVMETWLTVECVSVTDSCMGGRDLRCTDDEEKMKIILEADTCPWFVSDGLDWVQWVNGAFKRMLMTKEGNGERNWVMSATPPQDIRVWLVIKQELPRFCNAFSCKVRLQYTCQNEKCSRMLPCDVWKMGGGFAWRLDLEAALSLGR